MAANMQQHMAGAGPMMGQQVRRGPSNGLHQLVYQTLVTSAPPLTGGWQTDITIQDRMPRLLGL
jgi:hypothetical protein